MTVDARMTELRILLARMVGETCRNSDGRNGYLYEDPFGVNSVEKRHAPVSSKAHNRVINIALMMWPPEMNGNGMNAV
jgi:hypothetical protein